MIRFLSSRGAPATKQSSGIAVAHFLRLALTICVACALSTPARAHDPQETWTNATLLPDSLKVEITMAPYCAMFILDPQGKILGISESTFESYRPKLKALAADFYVVTSLRTPLKPREVEVRLTEENDLAFTIVYPRPAPGRLYFHASFLQKLGEGYGGTIYLSDPKGKDLGWDQISTEAPNFEVTLAAEPPPANKSSVPLQPAAK